MQTLDWDTIIKFGVAIFTAVSGVLLSIVIFFVKRFINDVRDDRTEDKKELADVKDDVEEISERLVRVEVLCKERRCNK